MEKTIDIENDDKYFNKFGKTNDFKSLGWGSESSQIDRFKILAEIPGLKTTDRILDVGCGYGDFCTFFENYKGIDLRESVIEIAKKKFPNNSFESKTIFEE